MSAMLHQRDSLARMPDLARVDMAELERNAARASRLLKAMSNDRRLMILCRLALGEQSVGELEEHTGLGQSSLSQHLAVLRRSGLVATRREVRTIFYRLASHEVSAIMATLYALYCGGEPANA